MNTRPTRPAMGARTATIAAAALALCAGTAVAADDDRMPISSDASNSRENVMATVQEQGDVSYVSGGIGDEGSNARSRWTSACRRARRGIGARPFRRVHQRADSMRYEPGQNFHTIPSGRGEIANLGPFDASGLDDRAAVALNDASRKER